MCQQKLQEIFILSFPSKFNTFLGFRNACSFLQYATQRVLLKKSGGCWGVNNGKWQQNQDKYATVTSFNDKLYTFRDIFSLIQTAHMKVYMFLSQNTPKTPKHQTSRFW